MKKNISISVSTPCSEKWSDFSVTDTGRFCGSCSTAVTDFTKMSDNEIVDFFRHKPSSTCGRFRSDQLKAYTYSSAPQLNTGMTLLKAGLMGLVVFLMNQQAVAHNTHQTATHEVASANYVSTRYSSPIPDYVVKGIVRSGDDNTPMEGVSVYLKDAEEGTISDREGRFEFPRKLKEGDILIFSFIGYEMQEYVVSKNAEQQIEIAMMESHHLIMGAVAVEGPYSKTPSFFSKCWNKVKAVF